MLWWSRDVSPSRQMTLSDLEVDFLSCEWVPSEYDFYDKECWCSTVPATIPRTGRMLRPRSHTTIRVVFLFFNDYIDRSYVLFPALSSIVLLNVKFSLRYFFTSLALKVLAEHEQGFLLRFLWRFGRTRTIALCFVCFEGWQESTKTYVCFEGWQESTKTYVCFACFEKPGRVRRYLLASLTLKAMVGHANISLLRLLQMVWPNRHARAHTSSHMAPTIHQVECPPMAQNYPTEVIQ